MPSWFLCKIRYRRPDESSSSAGSGKLQTINEQYLVDSVSFTDAEARITSQLMDLIKDFTLTNVSPVQIADVFHFEDSEVWYKCKVSYVSLDSGPPAEAGIRKSGKEKKIHNVMLVTADSVKQAFDRIEESLKTMLVPFEVTEITQTKILEIFPYHAEI